MTSFFKFKYGKSIYYTSECKVCGRKIILKDGQAEYGLAVEENCPIGDE